MLNCEVCGKLYKRYQEFIRHINRSSCINTYLEKYRFKELFPETKQYIQNKQKNTSFRYYCEFCGRGFFNRTAIGKHIQEKSNGPCRLLYLEKYGNLLENLPWNKKVKCSNEKCHNLVWPLGKTGLCQTCASKLVTKNKSRNTKLTKNKKFINNNVVSWRCEFCGIKFNTKQRLEQHSRDSSCKEKFYKKYRIRALFPWNNSEDYEQCISCGNVISKTVESKLCKKCSNQWKANFYQLGNPAFKKLQEVYDKYYTQKFYNPVFRKQILQEQHICPVCLKKLQHDDKLHLHHINYNKKDDRRLNLIFLHHSCHAKTNWDRKIYFEVLSKFNLEFR